MAKNKVSEWSSVASSNTDIGGIDIAEGCAPSGINNAIRTMMAEIKDLQSGTSGDDFSISGTLTSSGTLAVTGGLTLDGGAGTAGQVMVSAGSGNTPTWGNAFVTGMIMLWSGSIATIPSGWYLCDGNNGTPDLRNRFVIGAGSTYSVGGTGGSLTTSDSSVADTGSTVLTINQIPSHGHPYRFVNRSYGSPTSQATGGMLLNNENNLANRDAYNGVPDNTNIIGGTGGGQGHTHSMSHTHTATPPYYALAFIMKA